MRKKCVHEYGVSVANLDPRTVKGFGAEWSTFDQTPVPKSELDEVFDRYFQIFPWSSLNEVSVGIDLGCGSGRWAVRVAPRVGTLHCVDPSDAALEVAKKNLADQPNCVFHRASVDNMPIEDASIDFAYALGVLHHVPDTQAGIESCARKLKSGAPLLLYLYYAFDNRPRWFRTLWKVSDLTRRVVSRWPHPAKVAFSTAVAVLVYWPLARLSRLGFAHMPLSIYRDKSLYTMRTDALDRFGTRLEKRFTATEIVAMMEQAGLEHIRISPGPPFWCAVGHRV
jgi:ubiquinone/menaquinone biosynthesis C-methylase UbiE